MSATTGRVLIVDDNRTSRLKLALAMRNLGYAHEEAEDGSRALERLAQDGFDLVLLDIVMPGLDGFGVLERMKADARLREIPVLVISGMDDDMASVVRAIELGAEDFLPKTFDPVLLRARVSTCIERKKLRDQELDYLRQVEVLAGAAAVMERGMFHPRKLGLEPVAARPDALGRLARVFGDMADQVYERERALQRNIRSLKGGLLLLFVGAIWGLMVPLSRMIALDISDSAGSAFWTNLVGGILCCAWAQRQGRMTWPGRGILGFAALIAAIDAAASILFFVVAGHLPGIVVSIVVALEGFAVFLFAAAIRIEDASARRFAGLALGMAGVVVLLFAREKAEGVSDWVWIGVALSLPLLFATSNLLVALRIPPEIDLTAATGMMLLGSAAFSLPIALASGEFFVLGVDATAGHALILLVGVLTAVADVGYVRLVASTGAVFASQSAYVVTAAGVAWSVLLLGEALSLSSLAALATIIAGLALVGTKREAADMEVQFRRRSRRA